MHYYNDAFCRVLSAVPGLDVSVLSNYAGENDGRPFFLHQYKGKQAAQNMLSVAELPDVVLLCPAKQKSLLRLSAYGNSIDLPFMYIVSLAKKSIIDIHEAIAQNADDNAGLKRCSERYTPNDLRRSSFIPNGRTICWRNTAIGVTGCSYLISNIVFRRITTFAVWGRILFPQLPEGQK